MYLHQPTKQNQAGFSVIEVLLVVLVVAALTVISLLLYQHPKPTSAKTSAATSHSQTTPPQSTATTQTQQAATQYLTIKEWGVKLPLSNSVKDAYYAPATGSSKGPDGQPNTLLLGLKSLDSYGCAPTNTTALAQIFRALQTEKDAVTGKLLTQEYPNGVTFGNYFYAYEGLNNNSLCKAPRTSLQPIDSAFAAAAKDIVAATN